MLILCQPENLASHRFPCRFSELILCQLVQLHVSSWNKGVWLARTWLLHGFLLLPHKVRSAVGLRGSGAEIPDACVSTAADDQLLQVGRPAAERAARQAASRQASPENMAPAATQRGSEPTSSRRLRWSRLPRLLLPHLQHRWRRMRACSHQTPRENLPSHRFPWRFSELILCQLVQLHVSSWNNGGGSCPRRQNSTRRRFLPSLRSSAHIVTNVVGTNAASGAICTRCARNARRCTGATNAPKRELVRHRVSKGLGPSPA